MQPRSQPSSPQIALPWTVRSAGSSAPSYAALYVHATDASAQRQSIVEECHGILLVGRLGGAGRRREEGEEEGERGEGGEGEEVEEEERGGREGRKRGEDEEGEG